MRILIVDAHQNMARELLVALNNMEDRHELVALNFELGQVDEAPAELMLVPPGETVTGRDGRSWTNLTPEAIVSFFLARGLKIPIDIEHATELKAPKGEAAPAMAWCVDLKARDDGSVWAAVEWTPKGREMVCNKEYSYYSPAIIFDKVTNNIVGIKSVGLTNTPNFTIPALNREDNKKGASPMDLAQLVAALGLPVGTTFAAALNHISTMQTNLATALNRADNPPLDKFVPKADYELALNRATSAEASLKEIKDTQLETAINSEIDAALKAGKITPATKEYHVGQCRTEGGLERFKEFVKAAPQIAGDSNLDDKDPNKKGTALNAEELKIAEMFGNSAEDISKYGSA